MVDNQPWMIVQEKINIYDKPSGFVCCDRRQHLFILNYAANKSASISTISIPDHSGVNTVRSTRTVDGHTVSKSEFGFFEKKK